jgi:hypothetical protein
MRVKFGGAWLADSEDVVLLHEPGRYPVAGHAAALTPAAGQTFCPYKGLASYYDIAVARTASTVTSPPARRPPAATKSGTSASDEFAGRPRSDLLDEQTSRHGGRVGRS